MDKQDNPDVLTETVQEESRENKPEIIYKLKYKLSANGKVLEQGDARSCLQKDRVLLFPLDGSRLDIVYRDIHGAKAEDYSLNLQLQDDEQVQLYFLGERYDSFCKSFFKEYNAVVKKDSFMGEKAECIKKDAKFSHFKNGLVENGTCDISFGKTAVILQRKNGSPARIPYPLIKEAVYSDYSVKYLMEDETWEISMLADKFEACRKAYAENVSALMEQTSATLKQLNKNISPIALRKAAQLFFDGRLVSKSEADAVFEGLWESVFKLSAQYGANEYFSFLQNNAADMLLGFKKGLLADETYLWALAVMDGNIIMEAASPEKTGRATYIFRADEDTEKTLKLINYCMHMCEFRREPVYMSEHELQKEENAPYRKALSLVPELIVLRKLFVKRVAHTSFEKWKQGVSGKN